MQNIFPKIIKDKFIHLFFIEQFGLYAITLVASCRSAKQIDQKDGEDLWVEIDGRKFREIPALAKPQYQDVSPSWNGSQLKGLNKTIIFLLLLDPGEHKIVFMLDNSATIKVEPQVKLIINYKQINFNIEELAEDGDRRPWFSFVLIDLPVKNFFADVTANYRFRDSDDVKLSVDGQIKKNNFSILHRDWLWSTNILTKFLKRERQKKILEENLIKGIHYIDFWADRMPILHEVVFNLGVDKFIRIPSVNYPEWTGNFNDDSDEIILARLIFGEASGEPHETKEWIAWSVINRIEAKSWWPKTIRQVILQKSQYDPFKLTDKNYPKIINPLNFIGSDAITEKSWHECYKIAETVVLRKIVNPTKATHFHGIGVTKEWYEKNIVPKGTFLKKIGNTYFYWSPN
ncbi:MAG: cell wall hydrolase [Candidatus Parcubacteria bacterium]|nr:cell wall hydrolase [Candidatus Parcubacteria bacterium]